MTFFRYPGGKGKLRQTIVGHIANQSANTGVRYCEPFFGGGGIGLDFLNAHSDIKKVWINDKDTGIASLWTSVIRYPDELRKKIEEYRPCPEHYYEFKEELLATKKLPKRKSRLLDIGFKKLAIHQISYSGLGTKSGPLGGKNSNEHSKYPIDCRWSSATLINRLEKLGQQFGKMEVHDEGCTCLDFSEIIGDTEHPSLLYLDPPYLEVGNRLYQCGFTKQDHQRLADALQKTKHAWVLSYDDHPEVRKLYEWAHVTELNVLYSIKGVRSKGELLIQPLSAASADDANLLKITSESPVSKIAS